MDFVCSSCNFLILTITLCLKSHIGLGTDSEMFIKPSLNSRCPVKTCLTLSQLSVSDSLYENTILLHFLPGDHVLESEISITNISNFSMTSISPGSASIFCHQNANFQFEGIKKVSIKGLNFLGCGSNRVELVMYFLVENTGFIGGNGSKTALEIDETTACFIDTSFMYYTVGSLCGPIRILQGSKHQHAYVGGAIIANQSNVTIIRSEFLGNKAEIGGVMFATQGSKIAIKNSSFIGNSAKSSPTGLCFGGVLYIEDGTNQVHATPSKTTATINESEFSNNTATNGGILTAFNSTVNIVLSEVYNNIAEKFGGVMYIQAGSTVETRHSY